MTQTQLENRPHCLPSIAESEYQGNPTGTILHDAGCECESCREKWSRELREQPEKSQRWKEKGLQSIVKWREEWDWEARGGEKAWRIRWEKEKNGIKDVPVSFRPRDFIPEEKLDKKEPPPWKYRHNLCMNERGGLAECTNDHKVAGKWPCHDPHHDRCLGSDLIKLLIGMREEENPGHHALLRAFGESVSVWSFSRGPFTWKEIEDTGGKVIERARKQIAGQMKRWTQYNRAFHRGDRIILDEENETAVVRRFVLAAGSATEGKNKKRDMALWRSGETEEVVGAYLDIVGGAWTSGWCSEEVARVLVDTLKGAHRTESFGNFGDVLDEVELKRTCPECPEPLEFVDWATDEYRVFSTGKYWSWERRTRPCAQSPPLAAD